PRLTVRPPPPHRRPRSFPTRRSSDLLQAALRAGGAPPSQRLAQLSQLIDWLDSTKNQLFGIIAPFLLWKTRTAFLVEAWRWQTADRKSTRLNSSHQIISYAIFCLNKS